MQNEAIWDEILKVDRRGRVRMSVERREALLDEFEKCGVSGAQFARGIGVNDSTFAVWRQRRARERAAAQNSLVSATEAAPVASIALAKLEEPATLVTVATTQEPEASVAVAALPSQAGANAMRWMEAVVGRSERGSQGEGATQVRVAEGKCSIWITLPGGARVEMSNGAQAKLVAELLRELAGKGRQVHHERWEHHEHHEQNKHHECRESREHKEGAAVC